MRLARDVIAVIGFVIAGSGAAWSGEWMTFAWVFFAAFWFGMLRLEENSKRGPVRYTIHLDPHGHLVDLDALACRIATLQREGHRNDVTRGQR